MPASSLRDNNGDRASRIRAWFLLNDSGGCASITKLMMVFSPLLKEPACRQTGGRGSGARY